MSSEINTILTQIEQLEKNFDEYIQAFRNNSESVLQNLKNTWKMIKIEHDEIKKHENTINNQESEITKLKINFEDLTKKVDNLKLVIKAKAEEEKKTLFAAIKETDIAKELKDRKYDIPAQFIKLEQPIKQLGYYDIMIDFGNELSAKVGLTIEREQ